MPFEELPPLIVKHGPTAGQEASKDTHKNYRKSLDQLAARGYDTIQKLVDTPNAVIALVNDLIPGTAPSDLDKRRRFYSAVFWALTNVPDESKASYVQAFKSNMRQY